MDRVDDAWRARWWPSRRRLARLVWARHLTRDNPPVDPGHAATLTAAATTLLRDADALAGSA